jgi:transcriptional regulator of heat shock response
MKKPINPLEKLEILKKTISSANIPTQDGWRLWIYAVHPLSLPDQLGASHRKTILSVGPTEQPELVRNKARGTC